MTVSIVFICPNKPDLFNNKGWIVSVNTKGAITYWKYCGFSFKIKLPF